jgi:hypothetical protein
MGGGVEKTRGVNRIGLGFNSMTNDDIIVSGDKIDELQRGTFSY